MREYLYRGKRMDNGEWVYGDLLHTKTRLGKIVTEICTLEMKYRVYPETVGEFTGLTDTNGKKIFEGDIVSFVHDESFGRPYKITRNYEVQFVNLFSRYGLRLKNKNIHFPFKQSTASMHDVEVIGNIHDNPELLEVCNG